MRVICACAMQLHVLAVQEPFLVADDVARAAGDISGLHVIVTGSNTGIGKETARVLAHHGAHVVMACRSRVKAERAKADIRGSLLENGGKGTVEVMIVDLGSLQSVRQFAKEYKATGYPLHVLVANAGVIVHERRESVDGLELVTAVCLASVDCVLVCVCVTTCTHTCWRQVNWLAHFYMSKLLRPLMEASSTPARPARVVHVSSEAHAFVGMPWIGPPDVTQARDGVTVCAHVHVGECLFGSMRWQLGIGCKPHTCRAVAGRLAIRKRGAQI